MATFSHNLLWNGDELTGVLDFELADVTRRITELTLTWRCRHDGLVHAVDRIAPLNDHEWRMLLVDWWSQALTLTAGSLRRGRQPDWWELGALRRQSPLALRLERL